MAELPPVVIVEQPAKQHRFRYESEVGKNRRVDVLLGASSAGTTRRTYPTIEVPGYDGPLGVIVCLVNARDKQVNPHALLSADPRYQCSRGVLLLQTHGPRVVFNNIGVLCVRKTRAKDIENAFRQRREANIDPFRVGWAIPDTIDAEAVRLCFSVYLPGRSFDPARPAWAQLTRALPPALSSAVRRDSELALARLSQHAGSVLGGTEMFLCCKPYTGQNPEVVFRQGDWEALAQEPFYHRNNTVAFRTPPYRDPHSERPVTVEVLLRRRITTGEDEDEEYEESNSVVRELAACPRGGVPACRRPPADYMPSKLLKPTLAQALARRRRAAPSAPAPLKGPCLVQERMDEDGARTSAAQPQSQVYAERLHPHYTNKPDFMWAGPSETLTTNNMPCPSGQVNNMNFMIQSDYAKNYNIGYAESACSPRQSDQIAATRARASDVLMSPGAPEVMSPVCASNIGYAESTCSPPIRARESDVLMFHERPLNMSPVCASSIGYAESTCSPPIRARASDVWMSPSTPAMSSVTSPFANNLPTPIESLNLPSDMSVMSDGCNYFGLNDNDLDGIATMLQKYS